MRRFGRADFTTHPLVPNESRGKTTREIQSQRVGHPCFVVRERKGGKGWATRPPMLCREGKKRRERLGHPPRCRRFRRYHPQCRSWPSLLAAAESIKFSFILHALGVPLGRGTTAAMGRPAEASGRTLT